MYHFILFDSKGQQIHKSELPYDNEPAARKSATNLLTMVDGTMANVFKGDKCIASLANPTKQAAS